MYEHVGSWLGGAAGQAVYEDVDEELEALVGVVQGELVFALCAVLSMLLPRTAVAEEALAES